LYSTSANKTNHKFNFDFASSASDIIVYSKNKFEEKYSSKIYKLTKTKIKKIR
jgi:hypothetical protein